MVTNGLVYSDRIVESFEKYNGYYNSVVLTELLQKVPIELQQITEDSWMNLGSHICFSDDQYHGPISGEILDLYQRNGKNIVYSYTGRVEDSTLLKSGFSCYGDGSFEFLDEVSKEYSILNYSLDDFCLEKKSNSSRGPFSDKKVKVLQKNRKVV